MFCRGSTDGVIHDILMYREKPPSPVIPPNSQKRRINRQQLISSKTVICLAKTIKEPNISTIYADNYFTSIGLVEYLRDKYRCRYVGTARVHRIGKPPLKEKKDMEKMQRGTTDFCSTDGILALKWKDNKIVTILSSDVGVGPMDEVKRFCRNAKK